MKEYYCWIPLTKYLKVKKYWLITEKHRKLKLAAAANAQDDRLAAPITQNHDVERGRPAH